MSQQPSIETVTDLFVVFVTLLGPLVGPHAFILFGATLGAATALTQRHNETLKRSVTFFARVILTALFFTGTVATILHKWTGLPLQDIMGVVAYIIGWKWDVLAEELWPELLARLKALRGSPSQGG